MKKSLFLLFAATFILCSCAHQSLDEIRAENRLPSMPDFLPLRSGRRQLTCKSRVCKVLLLLLLITITLQV